MTPDLLQAELDRLQSVGRLPSAVAGVLRDGRLGWTGSTGTTPGDDPVDVQYRIGSLTKTFTAAAVMQLRDEGSLALDQPLGEVVPESGYAAATLRALLSHTSGMQSEPVGPWWERSPAVDLGPLLAANDGSGAVAGAGDYFHYSNLGFALLGAVVARLRGTTWWDVVHDRLLEPLGMGRTTYLAEGSAAQGYSVDHFAGTLTEEPYQDTGAMAPAGQAWSTLGDLARWAGFLASGHPDVLPPATLQEMATPVPPAADYGLGLRLLPAAGRRLVGHTGGMPGFQASLFVDPRQGDGVVGLANATIGFGPDTLPGRLLEPAVAPGGRPWTPTQAVPGPVRPLLGLWFWGNTAIEARWHNERLQLRLAQGDALSDEFELLGERLTGVSGYHRGETLQVHTRAEGSVSHFECATFVYTRTPYDRSVPVPGGHPDRSRVSGRARPSSC